MVAISEKLKIHLDDEGNVVANNRTRQDADLAKSKFDIEGL